MRGNNITTKIVKSLALIVAIGAAVSPLWFSQTTETALTEVKPLLPSDSHQVTGQLSLQDLQLQDGDRGLTTPASPEGTMPTEMAQDPKTHADTASLSQEGNTPHAPTNAITEQTETAPASSKTTTPKETTDNDTQQSALETHTLKEEVIVTETKNDNATTNNTVTEENSLTKEVNDILKKQTAEEKASFEEDLALRRSINKDAIATITEGSTLYLPPILSERALIVRYSLNKANIASETTTTADNQDNTALQESPIYSFAPHSSVPFISDILYSLTKAPIYSIETTSSYPKNLEDFRDFVIREQNEHIRPELIDDVPLDLSLYDTIYFCFPIWWQDLPAACYSFFDKYDLSEKNIIPVYIYNTKDTADISLKITRLEPNASVSSRPLSLSYRQIQEKKKTEQLLLDWLEKLQADYN